MRLFVTLGLACIAGCFSPKISNGGFACDTTQPQPCPTGFYCVGGLCVDHPGSGGGGGGGTGGNGASDDLALPEDMGASSGGDDLAMSQDLASVPPDLAQAHDLAQPPADLAKGSTCAHDICTSGGALSSSCDPCVKQVCGFDSYCCAVAWDSGCVGEVTSICGQTCP